MNATRHEVAALQLAVDELNEIEHYTGWGRVTRIAEVIARHFLSGDVDKLNSGEKAKLFSVRHLASHPACPLSKSQIHEVLAAYHVLREDDLLREQTAITPSHAAVVARLEPGLRHTLLRSVIDEGLSVRELALTARRLRRGQGERRGRPPTSELEKALTRFENATLCLEEGRQLLVGATFDKPETVDQLLSVLGKAEDLCRASVRACVHPESGGAPMRRQDSSEPTSQVFRIA